MVEQIKKIRHLMAEQKYIEAQQLLEQNLFTQKSEEMLGLLLEIHLLQGIPLPYQQTIEFIRSHQDHHRSLELIQKLNPTIETRLLEIRIYEALGELEKLYQKISELYIFLYERKIPRRFDEVKKLRQKYFASDFNLEMKELVLLLDLGWNAETENELKRIIRDCFQQMQAKNRMERLRQLEIILSGFPFNNSAKIYGHFLHLYLKGIQEKSDYKKIIELILYFDELDFKALILNLLDKLSLADIAQSYAEIIREQKDFKFIHFEKYYLDLKKYFIAARAEVPPANNASEEIDLSLEETPEESVNLEWEDTTTHASDLELAEGLKHLEYDLATWLHLSSGFIQSGLNKSALLCARKVKEQAQNDTDFLKGSYLAVHALMKLNDHRLALDYCYEALEKSSAESDLLSFLYLEAELLIHLKDKSAAQKVLHSIHQLDSSYRLSSKMLKRLNEI